MPFQDLNTESYDSWSLSDTNGAGPAREFIIAMLVQFSTIEMFSLLLAQLTLHLVNLAETQLAPRCAKNEQALAGVILKSERPSGPLCTRSGPPFFTFEHKIEALSTLMPSFAHSGPHDLTFWDKYRGPESAHALFCALRPSRFDFLAQKKRP